jgi:hypothetical protein
MVAIKLVILGCLATVPLWTTRGLPGMVLAGPAVVKAEAATDRAALALFLSQVSSIKRKWSLGLKRLCARTPQKPPGRCVLVGLAT